MSMSREEMSVFTDRFEIVFHVKALRDYIDTDRGVKVEEYCEAQNILRIYNRDTGRLEILPRRQVEELFDKHSVEAEEKALKELYP